MLVAAATRVCVWQSMSFMWAMACLSRAVEEVHDGWSVMRTFSHDRTNAKSTSPAKCRPRSGAHGLKTPSLLTSAIHVPGVLMPIDSFWRRRSGTLEGAKPGPPHSSAIRASVLDPLTTTSHAPASSAQQAASVPVLIRSEVGKKLARCCRESEFVAIAAGWYGLSG